MTRIADRAKLYILASTGEAFVKIGNDQYMTGYDFIEGFGVSCNAVDIYTEPDDELIYVQTYAYQDYDKLAKDISNGIYL
jgi:hypothetical protein